MLKKIYQELKLIRTELQAIRRNEEFCSKGSIQGTIDADRLKGTITQA